MDVKVLALEKLEQGAFVVLLRGRGRSAVELDDPGLVRSDQFLIVLLQRLGVFLAESLWNVVYT